MGDMKKENTSLSPGYRFALDLKAAVIGIDPEYLATAGQRPLNEEIIKKC